MDELLGLLEVIGVIVACGLIFGVVIAFLYRCAIRRKR